MSAEKSPPRLAPEAIDVENGQDVAFWAFLLEASADEVRQAVQLVGPGLFEVSQHLRARRDGAAVP